MTIHTLYELVQHSVKSFASKVAFAMYGGEELSYAEVGTRVKHVQDLLIGAGLKAGDKVALLSSNMPNWCISYFAVTSAGMVAVPILPDFSSEELEMIIEHSEARALIVSDKLFTKLSKETIGRLNVAVRTKNLGVIAQQSCGGPRFDGGAQTRRPRGDHLYLGYHFESQGRDALPYESLCADLHERCHFPDLSAIRSSRCCRCPIPTSAR